MPKGNKNLEPSILLGVNDIIDGALGLMNIGKAPCHQHKESCLKLTRAPIKRFEVVPLIEEMYKKITRNWHGSKSRGKENWRWKPNSKIVQKNKSREVFLERLIVETQEGDDWVNQVLVASGLTSIAGGRRAIDLVHRVENGWYELIELKMDHRGGTPLFAAMEILQYGLLYIFSRENAQALEYTKEGLLNAKGIHLKVLAPADYYAPYNLSWLEKSIDRGLASFLTKVNFKMDFKFETLSLTLRSSPWVPGGSERTSP